MKEVDEEYQCTGPYRFIADQCNLSERTVRKAFSRQAITWQTARKIEKVCGIPPDCFKIKADNRGRRKTQEPHWK